MGQDSKIEWTHHTFNPWRGCTKVSPGCANCYAEKLSHRNPTTLGIWGDNGTRVIASDAAWREPLKWDRLAKAAGERHRVFCASLADVFEDRPDLDDPRARLWSLIAQTPNLDWLLLTKRPENIRPALERFHAESTEETAWEVFIDRWPRNVWLGTSVENQATADERIPHLLRTPAAVRFLSVEPLLGPVNLRTGIYSHANADRGATLDGIGWVIVGGESQHGARPCDVAWIRSIVRQCEAARVPCFVKQIGSKPFDSFYRSGVADQRLYPKDSHGGDPSEWPEPLRVRQFPALETAAS